MNYIIVYKGELAHHGIPGQKWGIRRYQNSDGTWTEAGKYRRRVEKYRSTAENSFKKFIPDKEAINKERKRFREWDNTRVKLDYYDDDADPVGYEKLKKRYANLEDADPFDKVVYDCVSDVRKNFPNITEKQLEYVFYSVDEIFRQKIWDPALNDRSAENKTNEKSEKSNPIIEVGKKIIDTALAEGTKIALKKVTGG